MTAWKFWYSLANFTFLELNELLTFTVWKGYWLMVMGSSLSGGLKVGYLTSKYGNFLVRVILSYLMFHDKLLFYEMFWHCTEHVKTHNFCWIFFGKEYSARLMMRKKNYSICFLWVLVKSVVWKIAGQLEKHEFSFHYTIFLCILISNGRCER